MASRTGEGLCAPLVRWTWPKRESTQDYFLAGQRMPCFIVAMSMFASLTNAVSYTGIPGTAYTENIALVVLGVSSIAVTPLLALTFYPVYRRLNVTTSYEYVYHRFGLAGRFAVSGLFILDRLARHGDLRAGQGPQRRNSSGDLGRDFAYGRTGRQLYRARRAVRRVVDRCNSVHTCAAGRPQGLG